MLSDLDWLHLNKILFVVKNGCQTGLKPNHAKSIYNSRNSLMKDSLILYVFIMSYSLLSSTTGVQSTWKVNICLIWISLDAAGWFNLI